MLEIAPIFRSRVPHREHLMNYGFVPVNEGLQGTFPLSVEHFSLRVTVSPDGDVRAQVFDDDSGDEYVLVFASGAVGAFVGNVRTACEERLLDIAAHCFDHEVFHSKQAKAVLSYVRKKYGDEPEFLWKKFPENAVFRRQDNRKWYGALLTVAWKKLGFDTPGVAEILDVRMEPDELARQIDGVHYLPGYHMNKTHWVTLPLNDTLPTEELYARLDESYRLVKLK